VVTQLPTDTFPAAPLSPGETTAASPQGLALHRPTAQLRTTVNHTIVLHTKAARRRNAKPRVTQAARREHVRSPQPTTSIKCEQKTVSQRDLVVVLILQSRCRRTCLVVACLDLRRVRQQAASCVQPRSPSTLLLQVSRMARIKVGALCSSLWGWSHQIPWWRRRQHSDSWIRLGAALVQELQHPLDSAQ